MLRRWVPPGLDGHAKGCRMIALAMGAVRAHMSAMGAAEGEGFHPQ